jgi:hypothetical protein
MEENGDGQAAVFYRANSLLYVRSRGDMKMSSPRALLMS